MDAMENVEPQDRELVIATQRKGDKVKLSVTDNGCGISPEAESKLFDAFYTTKPEGMGIGLSISRSIIEAHNGIIYANNVADAGACFSFELPIHGEG